MKSKKALAVMGVLLASCMGAALVACGGNTNNPEQPQGKEYTVTFDANGGTLTGNSTIKVNEGQKITETPTATKTGHTFEAWYDAATDGVKITLTTYTVSADVTLYAHYTPNASDVKITFDANGGAFTGNKTTVEMTPDEDNLILDAEDPTKADHRFLGWFTAAEGGDEVDPMFEELTESKTLYAHWVRQYTVTFYPGDGTLEGSATVKVDKDAKITGAPTATKAGNDFYGWYTAAEGGDLVDLDTYTVTGDTSLYAKFGVYSMPLKTLKDPQGENAVGYRIEAEEAKAEGEQNTENTAHPGTFLEDVAGASGGHSLGYLGTAGNKVTFTFNSAAAGKATLSVVASSANVQFAMGGPAGFMMWGADQQLTGSEMTMTFNGSPVNYDSVMVRGASEEEALANGGFAFNFRWTSIPVGEVDVVAGFNSFVITVASTNMVNIDCLDIETTLTLTSANGDAASGEANQPEPPAPDVEYDKAVTAKLIVVDHADGPAVQKAVLTFIDDISAAAIAANPFSVGGMGTSATDRVYLSDAEGNAVAESVTSSKYVTIEYAYTYGMWGPNGNVKPFNYSQQTGRNTWKDAESYALTVNGLTIGETTYTKYTGTFTAQYVIPELDKWDLTGTYTDGEGESAITLKYASFAPATVEGKTANKPLIIWLHGAGEGGTNPSIVLLGNQVVNLGKSLIQNYFVTDTCAGAYVLAPQSPTMWMDNGSGTQGGANIGDSIYTEALFNLIKNFVDTHSDIDANRVYIGGCSNGGWMTVEMLSKHGEYFAAAYPIAVPFDKSSMTEAEFAKIVNVPMWITHAKSDMTVSIGTTRNQMWQAEFNGYTEANSNQLYIELLKAGAANAHYSLFETVTIAAGETDSATYDGHYSWIFTLRDECSKVQAKTGTGENGAFVLADITETADNTVTLTEGGAAVTLWGWIAAQVKAAA